MTGEVITADICPLCGRDRDTIAYLAADDRVRIEQLSEQCRICAVAVLLWRLAERWNGTA
jgi:hypothetical protein